jgi:hypothetical protein
MKNPWLIERGVGGGGMAPEAGLDFGREAAPVRGRESFDVRPLGGLPLTSAAGRFESIINSSLSRSHRDWGFHLRFHFHLKQRKKPDHSECENDRKHHLVKDGR